MRHVVVEGLPAVGKSEILAVLSRFYPERVRVLPEIVKEVATRRGIDLFAERPRLAEAILAEVPRRLSEVERVLAEGRLCLEESHLGVHLAYSLALGDRAFVEAYAKIEEDLPVPDLYVSLEIPIAASLVRQRSRGTPQFEVEGPILEAMRSHLRNWHARRGDRVVRIDADRPPSAVLADVERALELPYVSAGLPPCEAFEVLLLLGRPASGKSEFIDFMENCPLERRIERYHIGPFQVVDDFPVLWEKCEEDDLWERLGRPRLHSRKADGNYAVTDEGLWPFLIGKIDEKAGRFLATAPAGRTLLIEFSRGGRSAYADALALLSPFLLSRAAILYLSVSFTESLRRNAARYDQARRDGVLTHSVPREEMERTYALDDWPSLAPSPQGILGVGGGPVPYVAMTNEPESIDPEVLDRRYHAALESLYSLWREGQS